MKYFGYSLGDPNAPVGEPRPELYEQMGAFVEEATKPAFCWQPEASRR